VPADAKAHLEPERQRRRSRRPRLGAEPGKQPLQRQLAGGLHAVDLAILRHRPAALGDPRRQRVAIDGHALKELRQHARSQEPGDAPTDHQRVLTTERGHHRRARDGERACHQPVINSRSPTAMRA
jgi:hypothetical protein